MEISTNVLLYSIDNDILSSEQVNAETSLKIHYFNTVDLVFEFFSSNSVSLLIFDLKTPDSDIIPLRESIIRHVSKSHVPVLILIAQDSNPLFFLENNIFPGYVDFLKKPVSWEVLKWKIGVMTQIYEEQKERYLYKSRCMNVIRHASQQVWELDLRTDTVREYSAGEKVKETVSSYLEWVQKVHPGDRPWIKNVVAALTPKNSFFEVKIRYKLNGSFSNILLKGTLISDPSDQPYSVLGIISKDDEEETNENIFQYYDAITGLPNRDLFYEHLRLAIANAKRYESQIALMLMDIDHFQRINDSLGHEFGDLLLKEVTRRLKSCIRETDSLARLSGDEFVFIFPDVSKPQHAVLVANKILKELSKGFVVRNQEIYITASLGICFYPSDGDDLNALVNHADTAMYRAKNQGRNTYQLYASKMNALAFEHLAMENSFRRAIRNNELIVYYQPRVNILNGRIIGVEALVRWMHPDIGLITPDVFIPIAEETGLIIPMGEMVLEKACEQHKLWMKDGCPPFRMAVNLSGKQFQQKELLDVIAYILKKHDTPSSFLELEITESVAMHEVESSLDILGEIKKMGIRISIDDFGTGYSSLSYLKEYPIHSLKIDQSFLKDITHESHITTIVKAILEIAKGLSLDVIAEGVENIEQLKLLKMLGCYEMQGYFFSTPLPVKEITPLLKAGKIDIQET